MVKVWLLKMFILKLINIVSEIKGRKVTKIQTIEQSSRRWNISGLRSGTDAQGLFEFQEGKGQSGL